MVETALYILTGLTLYAGAHHLLADTRGITSRKYLVSLGVMYLLLSGFALTSTLSHQAASVTLNILLWMSLIWFVALLSRCRPLVLLDVLTAAWIIFLIQNSLSANSLRYVIPGEENTWWIAVEFTMLVSLLYILYASYRLFVTGKRYTALALGSGLSILLLVTLSGHLMDNGALHSDYLAPFGFAGFLLVISLYTQLASHPQKHAVSKPAVIPELTFNPEQATKHNDVASQVIPLHDENAVQPDSLQPPTEAALPERNPANGLDQETLNTISNNLIDIAAFATMTINYVKRGETNPRAMEMLCRKMRTHAINTRQLANQFSSPGDDQK